MRAEVKTSTAVTAESEYPGLFSEVEFITGPGRLYMDGFSNLIYEIPNPDLDASDLREAIQHITELARTEKRKCLVFDLPNVSKYVQLEWVEVATILTESIIIASYQFDDYKKDPVYQGIAEAHINNVPLEFSEAVRMGRERGNAVATGRDLANMPANHMTPVALAAHASNLEVLSKQKVHVKTLGTLEELQKEHFGLVLGVGQGSENRPQFIVVEYWGNSDSSEIEVVAIGKGVTFDTGGYSMKSPDSMLGMHHDMGGGATVLAAMRAIIKLDTKVNIVAIVPAVENSVSGGATRPGDILVSKSNLTVEVRNTDAEGRLILADALTYAGEYYPKAKIYIDFATLTGAAMMALGHSFSGLFTENERLAKVVQEASLSSGDPVWPLPLGKEYEEALKSHVADIANVQAGASKHGGASIAASFLSHFAREADIVDRHVHIDIAPRMVDKDGLSMGAGILLLIDTVLMEGWK